PVAALADVLDLVEEVEYREQRQEADQHEEHRDANLAADVGAQQLHAGRRDRTGSQRQRLRRGRRVRVKYIQAATTATPAWAIQTPIENGMRSCATQAWVSVMRLL